MIGAFPSSFEDELLYSILARFHKRSGNDAIKQTVKDLYGSVKCAVVDFPCNLSVLADNIPLKNFEVMNIIQKHTLLPYYKPFIKADDYKRFVDIMSSETINTNIHMELGIPANLVRNSKYLKYCQLCCSDEIKLYEECYWHRVHQLPGVLVCPYHKCSLVYSDQRYYERENRHEFVPLNNNVNNKNINIVPICINSCELEFFYYIAEQSLYLLRNSNLLPSVEKVNEYIKGQLEQQGFLTLGGSIKFKSFLPRFHETLSNETLKKIGLNFSGSSEGTWLHKILRQKGKFHPLKYLTVLFFFNKATLKEIANYKKEKQYPFGSPPYLCLNKASEHYKKAVIENVEISVESKTKKLVGTFSCECGFIYSRRGPDKVEEDRFKIGRIKEFGWKWKEKLADLNKQPGLSLRKIAKDMGTDVKTIKKYSRVDTNKKKNKSENVEKKVTGRKPTNKNIKSTQRIDWGIRDRNLAQLAYNTSIQILSKKRERVSKGRIGKMLGISSLLNTKIIKLPLTRIILIIICESVEDYQKRRIINVCNSLKANGSAIRDWKVRRLAGLKVLTPILADQINLFLGMEDNDI